VRSGLYGRIYSLQRQLGRRVAKHSLELLVTLALGVMAHLERYFCKHPGMTWAN